MKETDGIIENGVFKKRPDHDCYFMSLAYLASSRSKDSRTKCGSCLVFDDNTYVTGFNGTAMGYDESCLSGPDKHSHVIHSEDNSLSFAGFQRCHAQKNLRLYVLFKPCTKCALKIIQYGVKEVIYHRAYQSSVNDEKLLDIIQHNGLKRGSVFRKRRFKMRQYHGPLLFSHNHFGID